MQCCYDNQFAWWNGSGDILLEGLKWPYLKFNLLLDALLYMYTILKCKWVIHQQVQYVCTVKEVLKQVEREPYCDMYCESSPVVMWHIANCKWSLDLWRYSSTSSNLRTVGHWKTVDTVRSKGDVALDLFQQRMMKIVYCKAGICSVQCNLSRSVYS